MYLPDLKPLQFPPFDQFPNMVAVGWLEPSHEFPTGDVALEFVQKLAALLVNPWEPAFAMGKHPCGFCRFTGGPSILQIGELKWRKDVHIGAANLWLPADGYLFVAPSMILHYIDAHGYQPPAEFQAAVMACPEMRSMDYLKAIAKNGPAELVGKAVDHVSGA
jgi:hypothetical protein